MKIVILLHASAGGSGVVATELGLRLAAKGHEIHFLASSVPFRLTHLHHDNIYFHQFESTPYPLFNSPLTTLAEASKLTEIIEQYHIDVIHAHYAIPHATAALLARAMVRTAKAPAVVTTLHGTDVTLVGLEPSYLRTTQHAIEASDKVTAVSHYLAHYTCKEMGVGCGIEVVYNSVDVERFVPQASAEERSKYAHPDEKILMHISNFREVKRTSDVVRIFAKVKEAIGARLVMIGDGPEKPACVSLAQQLGVHGRIIFVPSFPEVEKVLAVSDILLLPSAQESFGLVALEAMACGVPVVASNIGGIPEVVEDGVSGFLHDLGDVEAMAHSALRLLQDDALHTQFSKAARQQAVENFPEAELVEAYEAIYQQAMQGKTC